jgi:hypothetical protein
LAPDDPNPLFRSYYASGRASLVTGDFANAAAAFAAAARSASDACNRRLAEEQGALAQEWASRGLAFVQRQALGESVLSAKAVDKRTGDEIVGLYTSAILYGLGTGAWIDVLTHANSNAGIVLPPLLGAGTAVAGVAALDSGRGLRYGVAQSISTGVSLGFEEGLLWALYQSTQGSPNWSAETVYTVIWGATSAGAVAGGVLGSTLGTTPGRASYVGSAGLWTGTITGLGTAAFTTEPNGAAAPLAIAALGLTAGSIVGISTAGSVSPSIAHVRFIDLGGVAGFLVGGGLYLAAANNNVDGHAFSGAAAVGTAAGLVTAFLATRSMPRDEGVMPPEQAATLTLRPSITPVAGGAIGGIAGTL